MSDWLDESFEALALAQGKAWNLMTDGERDALRAIAKAEIAFKKQHVAVTFPLDVSILEGRKIRLRRPLEYSRSRVL